MSDSLVSTTLQTTSGISTVGSKVKNLVLSKDKDQNVSELPIVEEYSPRDSSVDFKASKVKKGNFERISVAFEGTEEILYKKNLFMSLPKTFIVEEGLNNLLQNETYCRLC